MRMFLARLSNHNGQLTHQEGIHAFWESRVPELFAEADWDFFIGKAVYITDLPGFIWNRILESAAAADTVLRCEKEISDHFRPDQKYAFEERRGKIIKQYSSTFALYETRLNQMVERRATIHFCRRVLLVYRLGKCRPAPVGRPDSRYPFGSRNEGI
jgi:hypothetical protein